MTKILISLVAGLVFGTGLVVSGMSNPAKVIAFLDVTGSWDPSLAFVMGGGLLVTTLGFRFVFKQAKPLYDTEFHVPQTQSITRDLVLGSMLFGIGWGLVGLCPGPAITVLALNPSEGAIFAGALCAGMLAVHKVQNR